MAEGDSMMDDALHVTRNLHRLIIATSLVTLIFSLSLKFPEQYRERQETIDQFLRFDFSQYDKFVGSRSAEPNLPPDHYAVFKSLTKFAWVDRIAALKALGISKHNPRANGRRRLCSPDEFRTQIREQGLIKRNPNKFGIPQGSPMSAVLSNIYMLEFDAAVQNKVAAVGGLYRRYCDDILCVVPPLHAIAVEHFVMQQIEQVKLEIQAAKTTHHHFKLVEGTLDVAKPLQYLGFLFDGRRVLLRNAGLGRFYSRMRAAVRLAAATKRKVDKRRSDTEAAANPIKRKKLNTRYSYFGGRNFISYAKRAAEEFKDSTIKKQVRRHWRKLNAAVATAEQKLRANRSAGGK